MEQTTLRTSTIMVFNSNGIQWFRSKEELSGELRQKLEETMRSSNSDTLLLADRNGRAELAKALLGTPSALSSRFSPKAIAPRRSPIRTMITAPVKARRNDGIGLLPMTKRIAIGFTILLLAVIAIFAAKILIR